MRRRRWRMRDGSGRVRPLPGRCMHRPARRHMCRRDKQSTARVYIDKRKLKEVLRSADLLDHGSGEVREMQKVARIGEALGSEPDPPAPAAVAAAVDPDQLRRLGEALSARTDDVVAGIRRRSADSGPVLDAVVEDSFVRVGTVSTIAVARWMAGEGAEVAREVGQEAWQIFGQLAAQRAAPLNEVTKRCLRWRDAADEVLREMRRASSSSAPDARRRRSAMLQRSLDVTLVRMCESFEAERQRADEELDPPPGGARVHGDPRRADRAAQPHADPRPRRADAGARAPQPGARARRCSSTSTTSRRSTTRSATAPATSCCGRSPRGWTASCATPTRSGASAATSSSSSPKGSSLAAGPELIAERLLEALKQPFELDGRRAAALTVTASIGIAAGDRVIAPKSCCATPTSRCTAPSGTARTATCVFESGMQDAVQSRMELEMDLRDGASRTTSSSSSTSRRSTSTDMTPDRHGGADPLAQPGARRRPARRLHPAARGDRPDLRGRHAGCCSEACRQGAAWRRAGHRDRHGRQRLRAPARHRRVRHRGRATRSQQSGLEPERADARDHRDDADARRRRDRAAAASRSRSSACASRSTTSAPATPRSPTCSASPSTR